jgi:hypothetical protein
VILPLLVCLAFWLAASSFKERANITARAVPPTAQPNLLANGEFEVFDLGSAQTWAAPTIPLHRWVSAGHLHPGELRYMLQVSWPSLPVRGHYLDVIDFQNAPSFAGMGIVQIVEAQENTCYSLSANVKTVRGGEATLSLDMLDKNRFRLHLYSKTFAQSYWGRMTVQGDTPSGTRYIRVNLYTGDEATGEVYWDNVVLRECDSRSG